MAKTSPRPRPRSRETRLPGAVLGAFLTAFVAPATALGETPVPTDREALVTPPTKDEPPYWAAHAHLDFVAPVARGGTCPSGAACVLEGGTGIDLGVERRFPKGLSIGVSYSAYFLDGGGVYEIGVLQFLGARFHASFLRNRRVHPYLATAANLVMFGETFDVQTAGAGVDAEVGIDVELDPGLRLRVGLPTRMFVLARFTTPNDGVERAKGFDVEAVLAFRIGLVLLEVP